MFERNIFSSVQARWKNWLIKLLGFTRRGGFRKRRIIFYSSQARIKYYKIGVYGDDEEAVVRDFRRLGFSKKEALLLKYRTKLFLKKSLRNLVLYIKYFSHNKASKPTKTLSQKLLFVALRHRNFCANSAVGRTVFAV